MLDHIIFSHNAFFSFRENKTIQMKKEVNIYE